MIWVVGIVAALNLKRVLAQVGLIQAMLLDDARLPHQMVVEQRQSEAFCCLSKTKDVELPIILRILRNAAKLVPMCPT